MDATALARELLEAVPANQTLGIRVRSAKNGTGVATLRVHQSHTNAIGSLHASGLVALLDCAGIAAIIAHVEAPEQMEGVMPLGSAAAIEFLRPARGELSAVCKLGETEAGELTGLFAGDTDRVRLRTETRITDTEGTIVATGGFDWSVRRRATTP